MKIAAREFLLVELDQLSGREAFCDQSIVFSFRSVAVHDR